jgi:hypothetical protein
MTKLLRRGTEVRLFDDALSVIQSNIDDKTARRVLNSGYFSAPYQSYILNTDNKTARHYIEFVLFYDAVLVTYFKHS